MESNVNETINETIDKAIERIRQQRKELYDSIYMANRFCECYLLTIESKKIRIFLEDCSDVSKLCGAMRALSELESENGEEYKISGIELWKWKSSLKNRIDAIGTIKTIEDLIEKEVVLSNLRTQEEKDKIQVQYITRD